MARRIPHYLHEHALATPDAPAVRCGQRSLSYADLADRAGRTAAVLRQQGVCPGDRVGIYLSRGLESTVAIYGIMQAGAAYVPLDPAAPPRRIADVVQAADIRHCVSEPGRREALAEIAAHGAELDSVLGLPAEPAGRGDRWRQIPWEEVEAAEPAGITQRGLNGGDLAYVIFTSGSTGAPKGIMHTHDSGLAFARWAARAYDLRGEDRVANQSALHFDISVFDYFAGLIVGACTVVVPDVVLRLPASYSEFLARERITVLFAVPFVLSQLLRRGVIDSRDLGVLRWIIFGGDVHSTTDLLTLMEKLPDTRFSHVYGPAETNGCTYLHLDAPPIECQKQIPIGSPCEGMELVVVDAEDGELAVGTGELLVAGPTVMQGYWNRPDLNRRTLVRRRASSGEHRTYCRTGDRVEFLPDGNLRFLGRIDRLIKARGYRVELEEIEAALLSHASVEEAAAFAVRVDEVENRILAAVKVSDPANVQVEQMHAHLRDRLPYYAIPQEIEIVDAFPRTPSGKIDRRRLRSEYDASRT